MIVAGTDREGGVIQSEVKGCHSRRKLLIEDCHTGRDPVSFPMLLLARL